MVKFIRKLLGKKALSKSHTKESQSASSVCTEPTLHGSERDLELLSEETLWAGDDTVSQECQDLLDVALVHQQNGEFRKSILAYQHAMDCTEKSQEMALLLANICYIISRLYLKLDKCGMALEFAKLDYEYTKLAKCRQPLLTLALTCHELAQLAQYSLGESALALQYHQEALQLLYSIKTKKERVGPEVKELIRDTKNCLGRLHFEMGNVDAALGMLR